RAEPVRLSALVPRVPPRRRQLGATHGHLPREPADRYLQAGRDEQLRGRIQGALRERRKLYGRLFLHRLEKSTNLLEFAVGQPRRIQRQQRSVERLRVRIDGTAGTARLELCRRVFLRRCQTE